jgi:glycosyltransferase involved in cell wall biosynthesis
MSIPTKALLHYIRMWDVRSANGVDVFVTNSRFVGRRVEKVYRRQATVIYPPVATDLYSPAAEREEFYLTACRQVPYKRVDLLVNAFNKMPGKRLVVIGTGPDHAKLKRIAGPNVQMLGHVSQDELCSLMSRTKAFVYAAEEDFGIVMVEAQAAGAPVIALGRGGATEIVDHGRTGMLFDESEVECVVDAIMNFESAGDFDPQECRANALRFSVEKFHHGFGALVEEAWQGFQAELGIGRPESWGRRGDGPMRSEAPAGKHLVATTGTGLPVPTVVV